MAPASLLGAGAWPPTASPWKGRAWTTKSATWPCRPGSERATNNVAEYTGAIRALEYLRSRNYPGVVLMIGDSQLVIRQMNGEYEVRADHLQAYHAHLEALTNLFEEVRFQWVPREENVRADALSKEAIEEASARRRKR